MRINLKENIVFLIIFILFLVSSMSAVTYLNSTNIFDAKISYVNNQKTPYSVILNLEGKVQSELEYDIEIVYGKDNLVVASKQVSCFQNCEVKLDLRKVFFDKYNVIIRTNYDGNYYEKKLQFSLDKKFSNNRVILKPIYYIDENSSNYVIDGKLILDTPSKAILVAHPQNNSDVSFDINIFCEGSCDFSIPISSNIVFGKYVLEVYLPEDTLSSNFFIQYRKHITVEENIVLNDSDGSLQENLENNLDSNISNITYDNFELNLSSMFEPDIFLNDSAKMLEVMDIMGEKRIVSVNSSSFEIQNGYVAVSTNETEKGKEVILIPRINSYEDFSNGLNNRSLKLVKEKKGFVKLQMVNSRGKNFNLNAQSVKEDLNPIVYDDDKLYFSEGNKLIDLNLTNLSENSVEKRKLLPGIYKRSHVVRYLDGSETLTEDYFAYGLISINTKKPLYHRDEVAEMLIVVLDKHGFLVSGANIVLNVTSPNGDIETFSTENLDIYETDKQGVYAASILTENLGEYNLYAQVILNDMVVDVNSYFNVVNSYPFDIIRDVPATIDPWQGPFDNSFTITPLEGYDEEYDFTEVFSSDFTEVKSDADEINTIGDTTYLTWRNLSGVSKARYSAQVPLVTPYLYYLGKSQINYSENKVFYENRSWLFAIDPAAKVCDFNSPCICGASCSGGGEVGAGTIDTCTDGTTTYEFVNDIRITNLNGSYFGTGDTVEICVDFQTDSSGTGDRVNIGYKDAGTAAWANGHVIYDSVIDNNLLNTICVNRVLNNYVGTHNIRGKNVWQGAANRICDTAQYRDHDDVNITVLQKRAAYFSSWNLDNGSNVGTNLNVIRGSNLTIFALWDKPIQDAIVRYNSTSAFVNYNIENFDYNYTNYTAKTSNLTQFPNLGVVSVSYINSYDLYFNLSNQTTPAKTFTLYGLVKLNQSLMSPYVMYNGTRTNISCQAIDQKVGVAYANVNVSFYNNLSGFLGSSLTNSTGWANISYIENNIGNYTITCNITNELAKFYYASNESKLSQVLIVKANNTDITVPVISGISSAPSLFSIGGITTLQATVTDNINLTQVYVNVTVPNGTSYVYNMLNSGGNIFKFNFSNTVKDGTYSYVIYALDNSSNLAWTSTKYFTVEGIRTYIGIKSSKDVYKIGERINLTAYTKTSTLNSSVISEIGDIGYIYYSFDSSDEGWTHSGTQDEWERGVPTTGDLSVGGCQSGNCWVTDRDNTYNNNANNNLLSPTIDMSGRSGAKVTFWREIDFQDSTNDRIYFESYDGASWNILYQNTIGAENQEGTWYTYYPSEVNDISNAAFRFRMTTNANSVQEGFTVDSFNLSYNPKVDWNKSWYYYNTAFGINNNKTTAIKLQINITSYDATGSDLFGSLSPDIEVQIFNGSAYSGSYKCNLDSTKIYPYTCEFVIKNTEEFLNSWITSSNRNIALRAINLDKDDSITWSGVTREYVEPSIIENHGSVFVSSYLLEQFKNSTGGIVQTLYNDSITLNPLEAKQLNDYWNFSVPYGFTFGNYSSYVALTDAFGNILRNKDDNTYINDTYDFEVKSLLIQLISPLNASVQNESFNASILLNTTFYGSGGWCGYSLDGLANVTMSKSSNYYYTFLSNKSEILTHNITFYCNDTDNYMIYSNTLFFNMSQAPRVNFTLPTDTNNSYVNRSWTLINVSINDSSFNSSWLVWNGVISNNITLCSGSSPYYSCYINKSNLLNGAYNYSVCANDSVSNIGCSENRTININLTLPIINIISPLNASKVNYNESANLNITTSIPINSSWFQIDGNGTIYNLTKVTSTNWIFSFSNLTGGYHNITFYANDSVGNIVSASAYFYIIYEKDVLVNKEINVWNNNTYFVVLNITNNGKYRYYNLHDFIDSKFDYYNLSLVQTNSTNVYGNYLGKILVWNLTMNFLDSIIISYNMNSSDNFSLSKNYLVGSE